MNGCAYPGCTRGGLVLTPRDGRRCIEHALALWHAAHEVVRIDQRPFERVCAAEDCDSSVRSQGLCHMHYMRRRRGAA